MRTRCRWRQNVRALQSRCWTSAQPSMRFKPCCRPSEFRPNHNSPGWPVHSFRSYRGHHDANFNVAILDGHKEIVAHEKFQQLLHKKWGQRDKIHYGDEIRWTTSLWFPKVTQICVVPIRLRPHALQYLTATSQVQHLLERDEQGAEAGSCDKTGKLALIRIRSDENPI